MFNWRNNTFAIHSIWISFRDILGFSSWIRLSKYWNAWCVVLISYLFKLRCCHYGCNDTSSGPYWSCEIMNDLPCFSMLGQNSKCSSCGKPKETLVIECSSCEQWLTCCCASVSAGDDVVEFESVPFYCSQCLSTDRQQTCSSQDPTQCYHCHSQTGLRKKKTIRCSQCDWPFHLLRENFKTSQQTSWLVRQHLWPYPQPTTSPKKQPWALPWLTPLPLALIFNL